jgi:hypothetical protein
LVYRPVTITEVGGLRSTEVDPQAFCGAGKVNRCRILKDTTYNPKARAKLRKPSLVRTLGELKPEMIIFNGSPSPVPIRPKKSLSVQVILYHLVSIPASSNINPPPAVGLKKAAARSNKGEAEPEAACKARAKTRECVYM